MEIASEEQPLENDIIDYSQIPINTALSTSTRIILSNFLNTPRCLPTDEGLPKDWRGLAHLVGLSNGDISSTEKDPTNKVFDLWLEKSKDTCYIQVLINFLGQLDRWDIVDDTKDIINTDVKKYLNVQNDSSESAHRIEPVVDNEILTRHDVNRVSDGLLPQHYDAYVLFADADIAFATKLMEKLERVYNLKLCTKNRDLIGGHVFEHSAILKLIAERCNRLVIIVTQAFLESDYLQFFYNFAQALAIDQKMRKIVPLRLDACKLPLQFSYYVMLDYTNCLTYNNFWDNLYKSIKAPNPSSVIVRRETSVSSARNKPVIQQRPKSTSYFTENELEKENNDILNNPSPTMDQQQQQQLQQQQLQPGDQQRGVPFNDGTTVSLNGETPQQVKQVKSKLNWLKKLIHKKDSSSGNKQHSEVVNKKSSHRQKLAV